MSHYEESFDDLYRSFYKEGKTDGLPIVPPIEERVDQMLEGTDLDRGTRLGELGSRKGILTIEKLAVNGVMAGCLPIHMPVLVAGAKALADPKSNAIQASVSTGSWAYLFLVNGPIREALYINSDTGAFGQGYRSNQTIGRALGLTYKNCAQIHPGEKEMSTFGNPFKFSLFAAENEEKSPWEPLHVERGYDDCESTITFAAPNSYLQYLPDKMSAQGVVESMIKYTTPNMIGTKTETANEQYEGAQMEVFYGLNPYNAQELEGFTKEEIKAYLFENAQRPAHEFSSSMSIFSDPSEETGAPTELSPLWGRQFDDPNRINLFVAGGSGRFNTVIGPTLGGPTTKRITLPDNWDDLLNRHGSELAHNWGGANE